MFFIRQFFIGFWWVVIFSGINQANLLKKLIAKFSSKFQKIRNRNLNLNSPNYRTPQTSKFLENKIDMQILIVMLSIIRSISKNKHLEIDAESEFEIPCYLQFSIQLLSARRWNFKWASDNRNLLEIVWYYCVRSEIWYWLNIAFNIDERWKLPIFEIIEKKLMKKNF